MVVMMVMVMLMTTTSTMMMVMMMMMTTTTMTMVVIVVTAGVRCAGERVAVFINDLGGISQMELNIIAKESIAYLGRKLTALAATSHLNDSLKALVLLV